MPMHITVMGSPHAQNEHASINTLAQVCPQDSQGQGHSFKVKGHRTKIPCPCTSTPMGMVVHTHTQTGHTGIDS